MHIDPAAVRAFFNDAASDEQHYPSTIDARIEHVQVVLQTLDATAAHFGTIRRIADVGCGKGRFARIVKEQHPEAAVIALDLAEAMLRHVDRGIDPIAASMTALPLRTASVDAAYATESLEHAIDIETAVAELSRIVRPGGSIVIIDKNKDAWGRLETPSWERWFGRKELEQLLARHCRQVCSRPLSYWKDVEPDGLFLVWTAVK